MDTFISKYKYFLLLHFVIFIWGFTGILGGLISIPAVSLVWYRMLIAVAGVAIYAVITQRTLKLSSPQIGKAMAVGIVIALHWVFFYQSIKSATVSIAVVCLSFATFFQRLLNHFF